MAAFKAHLSTEGFPVNTEGAADEAAAQAYERELAAFRADPDRPRYGQVFQASNGLRVWVWSANTDYVYYQHLKADRDGVYPSSCHRRAWWAKHMTLVEEAN